jgi:hypothetical protein
MDSETEGEADNKDTRTDTGRDRQRYIQNIYVYV